MSALHNPYITVPLAAMAILAYVALRPDVQTLMLGCIGLLVFVTGCLWATVQSLESDVAGLEERCQAMNEDLTRLQKREWREGPAPADHEQRVDDMARTMAGADDWEQDA